MIEQKIKRGMSELEKISKMQCADSFKAANDTDDHNISHILPDGSTLEATYANNNTNEEETDVLRQYHEDQHEPDERQELSDLDEEDNEPPYTDIVKELD